MAHPDKLKRIQGKSPVAVTGGGYIGRAYNGLMIEGCSKVTWITPQGRFREVLCEGGVIIARKGKLIRR